MDGLYKQYSDFLAGYFEGQVQKLSVDLAFTCPNRDGSLGRGGCIYCNNAAFSPDAAKAGLPVAEQLARGKAFFARKYPGMRYLAYFQSYTSTYGEHARLLAAYGEALADGDVVGIVIGTRPDCLPDSLIESLRSLSEQTSKKIFIEFGVESSYDVTLRRINRHHTWADVESAVMRAATAGFPVGVHLILGLPGETEDMMAETVRRINALPVSTVKFHQLQILKGTALADMERRGQLTDMLRFTPESYAALCARMLKILRPDIAVDRFVAQAPADLLLSPRWGLKNYQFTALLAKAIAASGEN